MDVSLGDAAAILGLIGGAILYMIHATVAPLQVVLDRVVKSLDKLDATLNEEKARREEIENRLQQVEDRSKSNTHRLDKIEGGLGHG